MTRFIKNFIGDDEHIIYATRLHGIYLVEGLLWCVSLAAIGYAADYYLYRFFGTHVPRERQEILWLVFGSRYPWTFWMFSFCGVWLLAVHALKVIATEIALTGQRLIYKTGLFFVDVKEIDLAEIRAEKVHHGLLGRFFRYGELHLDARFVGDTYLPAVRRPYELLKAVHSARRKLKDSFEQ